MWPFPLRRQLVPHIVHPPPQRGGMPNFEFELGHSGTLCPICRGFVRQPYFHHVEIVTCIELRS